MATNTYDAIIVGSGITGGWAAKELTEKGLNTLVLEAGRSIVPERDYVEHVPVWELKFRGWDNRAERERTQHIQRECYYACDEYSNKFFVSDKDNPYTSAPGKHFSWIRGRQVGGKSITWGRQSYRWSDLDFEANLKDGVAVDWPIRYADIAPWYDYVEEFAGISGQAEGLPQLPDGKFLPPMEMTCVEQDFRDALGKHFDDRIMTIGRSAVLTRVHKGRAACHYCGVCHRGCITQSYFSSLNSTLPAAQKTFSTRKLAASVVFASSMPKPKPLTNLRRACFSFVLQHWSPRASSSIPRLPNFPTVSPIAAANSATTSWITTWARAQAAKCLVTKTKCLSAIVLTASTSLASAT